MSENELSALIEAIVVRIGNIDTGGVRPNWNSHQDMEEELQGELDDEVLIIKEIYEDILSEKEREC